MYAITLHQPWASLIALGIKTVETRSWPAPVRLLGQDIAIHAAKLVMREPGSALDAVMVGRVGEDWRGVIPAGMVVATATLAGMARVERVNLVHNCATHEPGTEAGCAVGKRETRIDPWGDFSPGRWLWFLTEVRPLPEPIPAVGRQAFWQWDDGMMNTAGPIP